MQAYLTETAIINFSDIEVQKLASSLSKGASSPLEVAKNCFEYVRDEIHHSGDYQDPITTVSASDVLKHKTGWCYAKSHLLAALLRANKIPTGFCYQRLSCSEYKPDIYGLNVVFLDGFGWYRLDARGNKQGVDAQFTPPKEQLAFKLAANEQDIEGIFAEPLEVVVAALKTNKTYAEMINNFPDYLPQP